MVLLFDIFSSIFVLIFLTTGFADEFSETDSDPSFLKNISYDSIMEYYKIMDDSFNLTRNQLAAKLQVWATKLAPEVKVILKNKQNFIN